MKFLKCDYVVSLHRGGQGGRYEVWTLTLRQRLPRIPVPLADGDPDVVLDLQEVFNRCYDAGAYARRLNYRRDPPCRWMTTTPNGPTRCCASRACATEGMSSHVAK